ncbi:MAG: tyrosine-type recombinase/integrase [Candidatus Acidiferrales bacterium]
MAVEKVGFSEKSRKSGDRKCLEAWGKSFVELPDAKQFLRIRGERVFQQPLLLSPPTTSGSPLHGVNIYHREFLPCVEAAGLRRITFHALRHSYASHLIQAGASLTYVKEQMGHSSIQVTVDTYGHLVPGADIAWVDKLDATTNPQPSATYTQPEENEQVAKAPQLIDKIGGPARIRT